jgi:hypothetical protein
MKLREANDAVLVKAYISIRDQRAQRKAAYEADDAADKDKQAKIEQEFMRRFHERGIDNVSAHGIGTAYRTTRSSCSVADRTTYFDWVAEDFHERSMFLEARANKTAVEQYKAANEDIPPGLNWREEIVVNFRRS